MIRRFCQLACALALLWLALWLIELTAFSAERAVPAWTWPDPARERAQQARLDIAAGVSGGEDPFLVLATNRLTGAVSRSPGRAEALRRKLHEHGVLAVEPSLIDGARDNTVKQASGLPHPSDAILTVALGAEDVTRNARETANLQQLPPARVKAPQWLPTVRLLLEPTPRIPLPDKPGLMPASLWPYRRGGVKSQASGSAPTWVRHQLGTETDRWQPTRAALALLRDELLAKGSRLLVLWTPNAIEASSESFSRMLQDLRLDTADVEPSRPARRAKVLCAELEIGFVDASIAFTKTNRVRRRPFAGEDVPDLRDVYSPSGLSLVFGVLAERVREIVTRR